MKNPGKMNFLYRILRGRKKMDVFSGGSRKGSYRQPAGRNRFRENPEQVSLLDRLRGRTLWFFPILLGLGLILLLFNGYLEIRKIRQLAQKKEVLILFNQEQNRKNEEMYREIHRLKQDPLYLEEIARKEFGLVKPDEIIFFLDEGHKKEAPSNVNNSFKSRG
jgi:cell division protein FtsB